MKRFLSILFLVSVVGLFTLCQKDEVYERTKDVSETGFSVADAKLFFEANRTRSSDSADSVEMFPLRAGFIVPDWEQAVTHPKGNNGNGNNGNSSGNNGNGNNGNNGNGNGNSGNNGGTNNGNGGNNNGNNNNGNNGGTNNGKSWKSENYIGIEVPFKGDFEYVTVKFNRWGEMEFLPLIWRLVFLNDPETGATSSFLRLHLPDKEYAERWNENRYADIKAFEKHSDFSGMVIYATTDGLPVSAARYYSGEALYGASIWNKEYSLDENVKQLVSMLDWVYVGRISTKDKTRAGGSTTENGNTEAENKIPTQIIDDLIVVSNGYKGYSGYVDAFMYYYLSLDFGGGGSSPSPGGVTNSTPPASNVAINKNIKTNNASIVENLKKLLADCMGGALINGLSADITINWLSPMYGGTTNYNYNNGNLKFDINIGGASSQDFQYIALLEELMHVYQFTQWVKQSGGKFPTMNFEVEAKTGWYNYLIRIGGNPGKYSGALGGKEGVYGFGELNEFVERGDYGNPHLQNAYLYASEALRQNISGYKDYLFNPDNMNLTNLMNLMKNC